MFKYELGYSELRFDAYTQKIEPFASKRVFFAAEAPQEMLLGEYQDMLLAIVDMPLWARVILGFVKIEKVHSDLIDDKFSFPALKAGDLLELYECIEKFLLAVLYKSEGEEKEKATAEDLAFLKEYLTSESCENYYTIFSLLCEIISKTFLAVSDKQFRENLQTEGKNVFTVNGRKFYLPAKAISEYINVLGVSKKIGKVDFDHIMKKQSGGMFDYYTTWQATTAIDFYSLSQSFDIIHNGQEISRDMLNAGNKIAFKNSVAAVFAALSREVSHIGIDSKISLKPNSKELTLSELESQTAELIAFFNENLTMSEAHQCNFFFANFITATANFTI